MHLKNTQQALKNQCFHMATLWGTLSPCPPSCTNIFLATPFDKFKAWNLKKKKVVTVREHAPHWGSLAQQTRCFKLCVYLTLVITPGGQTQVEEKFTAQIATRCSHHTAYSSWAMFVTELPQFLLDCPPSLLQNAFGQHTLSEIQTGVQCAHDHVSLRNVLHLIKVFPALQIHAANCLKHKLNNYLQEMTLE